ncbi:MAG: thiamine diphosphokinase [Anaerolineae bacterium]|nr:thiamine diphosphokinase [Anaerolineae bacterium]
MRALIFANGDLKPGPMLDQARQEAGPGALVIGADGGARHILALGLAPQVVIGDMDSIAEDDLARCRALGASVITSPPAKDETDLELALLHAVAEGATWLRVVGAMGGRLDQTLANVLLLTLPGLQGCDARLVAGRQMAWVLGPGEYDLRGAAGDTLSLVPLGGDAGPVTTTGLDYPLKEETLQFGPARGISNVFSGETARIILAAGRLLAVHTLGRA